MPIYNMVRKGSHRYEPPTWAGGTDAEIVEALQKHYAGEVDLTEYWSVGDERVISLSAIPSYDFSDNNYYMVGENQTAQDVTMVIMNVGGKTLVDGVTECAFIVGQKNSLTTSGYVHSNSYATKWKDTQRRDWCNTGYANAFPSTIKGIFKQFKNEVVTSNMTGDPPEYITDLFSLPSVAELGITPSGSIRPLEGSQFTYYETSTNRLKGIGIDGTAFNYYWTRSCSYGYSYTYLITGENTATLTSNSTASRIAPFGVI